MKSYSHTNEQSVKKDIKAITESFYRYMRLADKTIVTNPATEIALENVRAANSVLPLMEEF